MAVGEMPEPSGTRPDRYFNDILADELSANAPVDETNNDKNTRRERNRKEMNGVDISANPFPYGISQRPWIESLAGCTLPPNSASCLSLR
jgi:hypothetical protein